MVNVELTSQIITLIITSRYMILGEYHIRWQSSLIKRLIFLTVAVTKYLATKELGYIA